MKKLFRKLVNRETLSYLFFGALTTLVNFIVFDRVDAALGSDSKYALLSNAIAFIAAVTFAYLTNKPFVFRSMDWSFKTLAREIPIFFGGRLFSFLLEEGLLAFAKDVIRAQQYRVLGIRGLTVAKVPISVLVVILNYIFSKFLAFRKREQAGKEESGQEEAGEDARPNEENDGSPNPAQEGQTEERSNES